MLRRIISLIIGLIFLPTIALSTTIYKSVDAGGNITFSDQPSANSEKVSLPSIQTFEPSVKANPKEFEKSATNTVGMSQNYKSLIIVSPKNDEAVRQNAGVIIIQLQVDPSLKEGDQFKLLLDNKPMGNPQSSPTFVLTEVNRGTHSIQAEIINSAGMTLIQSPSVTFHLLRYHIAASQQPAQSLQSPPSPFQSLTLPQPLPLSNNQIQTLKSLEKAQNIQPVPSSNN